MANDHAGFVTMIGPDQPSNWQATVYGGGRRQHVKAVLPFKRAVMCPVCLRTTPCNSCRISEDDERFDDRARKSEKGLAPTGYDVLTKLLKSSEAAQQREEKRTKELSERALENIYKAKSSTDQDFTCKNEAEVMFLFAEVAREIGYHICRLQPTDYPDGIFADKNGNPLRIEFEYIDSNFITHAHNPDEVDLIVCWKRTKRGKDQLTVPVIALEDHYYKDGKRWDWSSL